MEKIVIELKDENEQLEQKVKQIKKGGANIGAGLPLSEQSM